MNEAVRKATMPLSDMLEQILDREVDSYAYCDSTAALAATEKGASPTMRYLRKNQRVALGCARDYHQVAGIIFGKIDGEVNVADCFTKALDHTKFKFFRASLGVLLPEFVGQEAPCLHRQ